MGGGRNPEDRPGEDSPIWGEAYAKAFAVAFNILHDDVAAAHEAANETALKLWQNWSRIRGRHEPRRRTKWVAQVARTTAIDVLRRQRRAVEIPAGDDSESVDETDIAEEATKRVDFHVALAELPLELAVTFLLKEHDGLRTKEIAERLGITDGAVRNRLWKAKRLLRRNLGS